MHNAEIKDTTIYKGAYGISKNNRTVSVMCNRYESFGKEILQGVELRYVDNNFINGVSDEL